MSDETQTTIGTETTEQSAPATQPATTAETTRTFTQDEVNALMGKTRQEAKQSATNALLKENGYESLDDLLGDITEHKKRKEGEMSALEKAQAEAEKLRKQLEALSNERETLLQARKTDKLQREIEKAANGAIDIDDVITLINRERSKELEAAFTDDGVDGKKVEKIVSEWRAKKPHLFKSGAPGSPSNSNGQPNKPDISKVLGSRPLSRI